MFSVKVPYSKKIGSAPADKKAELLKNLPSSITQRTSNYNNLHEQPTLFYGVSCILSVAGEVSPAFIGLAWAYTGLRVAHSLIEITSNKQPRRFLTFLTSSVALLGLTIRAAVLVF